MRIIIMLMNKRPAALLVNPWITDFAAYDFWFKPVSLLYIGAILREAGISVRLIDCLDRTDYSQAGANLKKRPDGTGRFLKTECKKPAALSFVPRIFGRYGISRDSFMEKLDCTPRPDFVFVTSSMTYWYPGVFEAIGMLKEKWPETPVALGGRYATICMEHARENSAADVVLPGPFGEEAAAFVGECAGVDIPSPRHIRDFPLPAHDLHPDAASSTVLFSRGCPFSCTYCVASRLNPRFEQRRPEDIASEIIGLHRNRGTKHIAFADDALLVNAEQVFILVMREACRAGAGINFYIPNAVHARNITAEIAALMKENNFTHIRLGFESSDAEFQAHSGGKIDTDTFRRATRTLRDAGFRGADLGAYILCGHPEQRYHDIENALLEAAADGVEPVLTEYSPIPGSPDFELAVRTFTYPPDVDPLLHNSSIIMFQHPHISTEEFAELKNLCKRLRKDVREKFV